jgi:PAP2 superfamily
MKARWFLGMLIGAVSVPAAYTGDIGVSASPIRGSRGPFAAGVRFATQPTSAARASAVMAWNGFASNLVATHLLPGPQTYTLAMVHIAIHDALNSIEPRYKPYAFDQPAPGASTAAAVAAATRDVLVRLMPPAAAAVGSEYEAALSLIPAATAKDAGIATGRAAAAAILERRSSDNLLAAITTPYTPGAPDPGVYQLTSPLNFVILAGWSDLPTFALKRAGAFPPQAPPSPSSVKYATEYAEVKGLGSSSSSTRTAEQTETAQFWYNVATKEWNLAAQQGLAAASADEWQAARTLAVLNVSLADAVFATFETKFRENYWRPITAIHAGDNDGNAATVGDFAWQPLCVTPPFPEYPSTHAATGAAAASSLALALGDQQTFTMTNPSGASRSYDRFSAAAFEEGISRIYCGIHFRSAMLAGFKQGERIAHYVHTHLMKPHE